MANAPENMEELEANGSHNFDIIFRTKKGGSAVNPTGFDPASPTAVGMITAEVELYNVAGDTWGAPPADYNKPTVGTITYSGNTGDFYVPLTGQNTRLTSALSGERWGIKWTAPINGVTKTFREFLTVVEDGAASFSGTRYCSPEDVALLRREREYTDIESKEGRPTRAQLLSLIDDAMDEIDRLTGNSWRSALVTNEMHDLDTLRWEGNYYAVPLHHRKILPLVNGTHKIEVFDGNDFVDWVADASRTEGRNKDYWIDTTRGILYLRLGYQYRWRRGAVRVTYAHGETTIPGDIRTACKSLVAAELEDTSQRGGGDGDRRSVESRSDKWLRRAGEIINNNLEWRSLR